MITITTNTTTSTTNKKSQLYPKERVLTWAQNGHLQECSVFVWVLDPKLSSASFEETSKRIEITISALKNKQTKR